MRRLVDLLMGQGRLSGWFGGIMKVLETVEVAVLADLAAYAVAANMPLSAMDRAGVEALATAALQGVQGTPVEVMQRVPKGSLVGFVTQAIAKKHVSLVDLPKEVLVEMLSGGKSARPAKQEPTAPKAPKEPKAVDLTQYQDVLMYVRQHPGCSVAAATEAMGGDRAAVQAALAALRTGNQVVTKGAGRGTTYWPVIESENF